MTSEKYECEECNYKTNLKYNFNRHMMLNHEKEINKKTVDKKTVNKKTVNKKTVDKKCEKCLKIRSSNLISYFPPHP